MRKNLQNRVVVVATVLERLAIATASNTDKNLWGGVFDRLRRQPPANQVKEMPKIKEDETTLPVRDIAEFLKGGPIPLEISNPLTEIAKSLAAKGAVSGKDAGSVVIFLAKMLRKYLGGASRSASLREILAEIESDSEKALLEGVAEMLKSAELPSPREARLARLAAKRVTKKANLSNLTAGDMLATDGQYFRLTNPSGDLTDGDNWEWESGKVQGKFVKQISIDEVRCLMFKGEDGTTYAAMVLNMTKVASAREARLARLAAKK